MENKQVFPVLSFCVNLNPQMQQVAKQWCLAQNSISKSRETYLNMLAVLAMDFYCQCMDIDTNLKESENWDTTLPTLMNTGGLFIKGKGLIECRPVLPGEKFCYIPPEVWSSRIGYVVVEINEAINKATILGFIQKIQKEELLLTELNSLEDFLVCLNKLNSHNSIIQNTVDKVEQHLIRLNEWFTGSFDFGWQSESLVFAGAMTKGIPPTLLDKNLEVTEVTGAKIIRLMKVSQSVILILRQTHITLDNTEIVVRLYPADESIFLPDGIKITILDETGEVIPQLEKQARANNWIQLRFKGNPGDIFRLQVSYAADSVTEAFLI